MDKHRKAILTELARGARTGSNFVADAPAGLKWKANGTSYHLAVLKSYGLVEGGDKARVNSKLRPYRLSNKGHVAVLDYGLNGWG